MAAAPSALGSRMAQIRGFRPDDLDALYRICLATGDAGADAAHLYRDPKLIGHVYAGGYAAISPETVFVAEDDEGIARLYHRPRRHARIRGTDGGAVVASVAGTICRCRRSDRRTSACVI